MESCRRRRTTMSRTGGSRMMMMMVMMMSLRNANIVREEAAVTTRSGLRRGLRRTERVSRTKVKTS
jgi:hypothetical protein